MDLLGDVDGVDCGIVLRIINADAEAAEIKKLDARKMYVRVRIRSACPDGLRLVSYRVSTLGL